PPTGGSHGKPHRTTTILSHAWRGGSGVAVGGACAADGKAPDHRARGRRHTFDTGRLDRRLCAATARAWLAGEPNSRNQGALGGGTQRTLQRNRCRVRPTQGRCIVTQGTPATIAAKQVTSVIPIVFVGIGDPVGTGLVASLARPGGNVSGLSAQMTDTAPKPLAPFPPPLPALPTIATLC